jgi:RND family efflux transporter MFP subunit
MINKFITLFSLAILAGSCSMNDPQTVEKQIEQTRNQVKKLNEKLTRLEKQLEEESENDDVIFRVPVSVKEISPEIFRHFIEITGKVEAEENAFISPEMNGQIEKIHVREGEVVRSGQLLVSLNTTLIESSIGEVKTGLELATKLYDKQKELWDQQIGSELQYLEAKNAMEQAQARLASLEAQLDMARIKAPFDGIVETIMKEEGELAIPGVQLIQLISLGDLKIYGNISERYLTSIRKGDRVEVRFPDAGNMTIEAPVYRIGNIIDNSSRTFMIEVKIHNHKESLKPNMYSIIRINDFSSSEAFTVPSIAIKQDIKGSYVYVADIQQQKAVKRYIEPRLSYEDKTLVEKGLAQGDQVIVKGFSQVSDGVDIELR